jgi:hypothetical protein
MAAGLTPAIRKPLALASSGDPARFLGGDGSWEEGAPPLVLDLDRDGVEDYVALSLVDADSDRRALVVHGWGEQAGAFGEAVFYLIVGADGAALEWGGEYRLPPRTPSPGAGRPPAAPAR